MFGPLAARDLFERLADDQRIEAEGVLVDAAVGQGERRGLAVGDHHDLLHVFALALQNALRHAQALARVGVVRPDLDAGELRDRNLLGGIVKEHERERVAGILRADEMRERHGDVLGRREAVFAVKDHGVRAVEHDDGRAGALILALVHLQVAVLDVERQSRGLRGRWRR